MVVVPAGTFLMGSPEAEEGRNRNEERHEVTIGAPFAAGVYELTVAEWDACVEAGALLGRERLGAVRLRERGRCGVAAFVSPAM